MNKTFIKAYRRIRKQVRALGTYDAEWWRHQDSIIRSAYRKADTDTLEREFGIAFEHAKEMEEQV